MPEWHSLMSISLPKKLWRILPQWVRTLALPLLRRLRRILLQRIGKLWPILPEISDGAFIAHLFEVVFGRGARANEIFRWQERMSVDRLDRANLLASFFTAHVKEKACAEEGSGRDSPTDVEIMGTGERLTLDKWRARALELSKTGAARTAAFSFPCPYIKASGEIQVTAIASLYKGGRYIENFLQNVTRQNLGDAFELVIIDANSPDNEVETIRKYQKIFKNIVYKRFDFRIGIYDAWNVAIDMARGKYLTNANVDDLRHPASLQIQADVLDRLPFVDTVYQDFYYTLDPDLDFDEVAAFGFKSDVPIVTPLNLLHFNSPHNAPMWRKRLHAEVGYFDATFKSAGDYDFWMRCLAAGKTFYKINTPHVVYYQNPTGVSTSLDMPGIEEGHRLFKNYARRLQSPHIYGTRSEFIKNIQDMVGDDVALHQTGSFYDLAAAGLLKLANDRKSGRA
jgi:glycosyltransferase involved in cell wall biosynthesis